MGKSFGVLYGGWLGFQRTKDRTRCFSAKQGLKIYFVDSEKTD